MSENTAAHVHAILTSPSKGEPLTAHESIQAVAGRGLEGDRYYLGTGYYSGDKVWDAHVTLMEQEAVDAVNAAQDKKFTAEMLRRNIITKNVRIKDLIGKRFRIGDAVFEGWKEWPPCNYVAGMNDCQELLKHFAQSSGIGASILETGEIRAGDSIEILTGG